MARWVYPIDPTCPFVESYRRAVCDDPMTHAMGAPVDDIMEAFERRHMAACERCRNYGAANVEAEY